MRRRVIKVADRRYQVELPGEGPTEFSYHEKARTWNSELSCYIDFDTGEEDRYSLHWEGLFTDTFPTETEVLLFILKFGYAVNDNDLVPSEILADFELIYQNGMWVDQWGNPGQNKVTFAIGEIQRPTLRRLRFGAYPRITPKKRHRDNPIFYARPREERRTKLIAGIQIPELDFAELEKPGKRRRRIHRGWRDRSEFAFGGYMPSNRPEAKSRPDEECVFTLEIGEEAEKAHQARKKKNSTLQE